MAHPHKKEALEGHARKATHLSGGKMTAGADSGPGRLQKIALQGSHPALEGGGEPAMGPDLSGGGGGPSPSPMPDMGDME